MAESDFSYEFKSELPDPEDELKHLAEDRLLKLAEGHTDITGAAVVVENYAEDNTLHAVRARVVVYSRPEYIAASKIEEKPLAALKSTLDAIERQVREKRNKLGEQWKQP